jgi:hypothetical protein
MPWLTLALKYRKWIAYAALLAALIAVSLWYRHSLIAAGDKAGAARVTLQWQADTEARQKVTDKAIADAAAQEKAARLANVEIENAYFAKVAAATADRDSVYRLLQQARNQVRGIAAREATGATIAATAGEASIVDRIDRAVAGVVTEDRTNADQLDALIAVVKPQM